MNAKRPEGRSETPGGARLLERSQPRRWTTAVELAQTLELMPRLRAIADELAVLDDADVPATLADALLEELEQALAAEEPGT